MTIPAQSPAPSPTGQRSVSTIRQLFHQTKGALTSDLLLAPGKFGLGRVPNRLLPDATTQMVCGFCSTGCSLNVHLRNGQAINLTPTVDSPVNLGMACPKGWEALSVLDADDRGTVPLIRDDRGHRIPLGWNAALQHFCRRIRQLQKRHGSDSVAFLSTGQIPTEEMALLGALAKFGMGIRHGDGNTRQCMATAVVAYKQSFGFDAPPYCYDDFEKSDVIVLVGANLCIAHPIMWQRILRNKHQPQIIVLDPRCTETADAATDHIALRPKSDLALLYGTAKILVEQGWVDHSFIGAHTQGFDSFVSHVQSFTTQRVQRESGVRPEQQHSFARAIGLGKRVSFWWTMGVNQSYEGVRTAQAIINLALMTGNIGKPGTGANSITGQCNAMGSRLFSNTTNLLGGHEFESAQDRAKVGRILEIDQRCIPSNSGWAYDEIIEAVRAGTIKALWVICTNPAHSWINQNAFREIRDRLEFLVVQDMYHSTETAQLADLYLPAAGWGEKDGTFINSERRIGLIKKVRKAPGQALADFAIFQAIASHWGCGEMFRQWTDPETVFGLLKQLSQGQPCDFSGIASYEMLDRCGGIQWPFVSDRSPAMTPASAEVQLVPGSGQRLFSDGRFFHADGRARFQFEARRPMPEPPSDDYPYLLLTGRGSASQWHTQTRTSKSAVLNTLHPQSVYVEMNPRDARREQIRPDQEVIVQSRRGTVRAVARVTPTIPPGNVFIPMHYQQTNCLTHAHFDPYSKQPSYKDCAVAVRHLTANNIARGKAKAAFSCLPCSGGTTNVTGDSATEALR